MENSTCKSDQLEVKIRASRNVRFKAGSELSDKVNVMDVDFHEEVNETSELIEVKIKLSSESCEAVSVCEN